MTDFTFILYALHPKMCFVALAKYMHTYGCTDAAFNIYFNIYLFIKRLLKLITSYLKHCT